jgi:tRNA A37 methylthiotransferase MiaB
MKNIYVFVRACDLRLIDATKIIEYLKLNDYTIVYDPKDADIILFITCSFSSVQSESALDKIKEFQKNYKAELIVGGCLPDIYQDKLSRIFKGITISTKDICENSDKLDKIFSKTKVKFKNIKDANIPYMPFYGSNKISNIKHSKPILNFRKLLNKSRLVEKVYTLLKNHITKNLFYLRSMLNKFLRYGNYYEIRISWGCPGNCSYCVIKRAVGNLKSKPLEECIAEFKKGLKLGYKTFIINADDTGAYGLDIGSNFPELLDKITEISGDYGITILDLNPRWIVRYIDELENIVKRNKIKSLEIPIQSGSERILKLMRRYSDVEKIKKSLIRLKEANKNLNYVTHQILGFPSETMEDVEKTLSLFYDLNLDEGFVFSFSSSGDSDADKIEPKISENEICRRLEWEIKHLRKRGFDSLKVPHMNSFVFRKRRGFL